MQFFKFQNDEILFQASVFLKNSIKHQNPSRKMIIKSKIKAEVIMLFQRSKSTAIQYSGGLRRHFTFTQQFACLLFRHRMNQHRDLKSGVVRFMSAADYQILCPSSLSTPIFIEQSYWILEYRLQQIQNCHISWK